MLTAVLAKLEELWFKRQSISRIPHVKLFSASSSKASMGVLLPSSGPAQRIRFSVSVHGR
jgi:hypothetical protein